MFLAEWGKGLLADAANGVETVGTLFTATGAGVVSAVSGDGFGKGWDDMWAVAEEDMQERNDWANENNEGRRHMRELMDEATTALAEDKDKNIGNVIGVFGAEAIMGTLGSLWNTSGGYAQNLEEGDVAGLMGQAAMDAGKTYCLLDFLSGVGPQLGGSGATAAEASAAAEGATATAEAGTAVAETGATVAAEVGTTAAEAGAEAGAEVAKTGLAKFIARFTQEGTRLYNMTHVTSILPKSACLAKIYAAAELGTFALDMNQYDENGKTYAEGLVDAMYAGEGQLSLYLQQHNIGLTAGALDALPDNLISDGLEDFWNGMQGFGTTAAVAVTADPAMDIGDAVLGNSVSDEIKEETRKETTQTVNNGTVDGIVNATEDVSVGLSKVSAGLSSYLIPDFLKAAYAKIEMSPTCAYAMACVDNVKDKFVDFWSEKVCHKAHVSYAEKHNYMNESELVRSHQAEHMKHGAEVYYDYKNDKDINGDMGDLASAYDQKMSEIEAMENAWSQATAGASAPSMV